MTVIDQLVYTWSDIGLSGQTAGFRIRAASQGLSDDRNMRYRLLEAYLQYNLPPGVRASSIHAADAPISLALIHTSQERILVRKELLEADGAGRPGAYLTHLLAGLPAHFSARDAILLWHDDLWVTTKNPLGSHQLSLDPIPEQRLCSPRNTTWKISSFDTFRTSLRLALAHFLDSSSPPRLYLSGSSESIATLIWGITQSLPLALIRGVTFNTYEDDLSGSNETIVGLFSERFLPRGESAFDVDTATVSSLPEEDEVITHYSNFAADALYRRARDPRQSKDQLATFIERAEQQDIMNATALLQRYQEYQQEQRKLREQQRSRVSASAVQPPPSLAQSAFPASYLSEQATPQNPSELPGGLDRRDQSYNPPPRPVAFRLADAKTAVRATASQLLLEVGQTRSSPVLYRSILLSAVLNALLFVALIISLIALPVNANSARQNAFAQLTQTAPAILADPTSRPTIPPKPPEDDAVTFLPTLTNTPTAKANASFAFAVEVQNSGSNTWSPQQKYQLKCIPDPAPGKDQDCPGVKVLATVTVSVPSRQNYIFVFTTKSPGPAGKHTLKIQMFRDQTPFGLPHILSFIITS